MPDPVSPGDEPDPEFRDRLDASMERNKEVLERLARLEGVEAENENLRAFARDKLGGRVHCLRLDDLRAERGRAEAAESRAERAEEAIAELVRLKDGPRHAVYEIEKPLAWDCAREVLASLDGGPDER